MMPVANAEATGSMPVKRFNPVKNRKAVNG